MTPKSVAILAVVTAVCAGGAAMSLNADRGQGAAAEREHVFPGLLEKTDAVAKIVVERLDGEVTVERGADGAWVLPGSDGYPADPAQVQKAILQVANLRVLEAKTAKPKLYSRLDVEQVKEENSRARLVRLSGPDGAALAELVVGRNRYDLPGTETEGAYIRKPDNPQTWLAVGEITVDTDLKTWLGATVIDVKENDVASLEVRHPGGEAIRISKDDPKAKNFTLHDIPDDKRLEFPTDPNNIASVVEDMEMQDARKADKVDFAANKTVSATYTTRTGLVVDLWLTGTGDDNWLKLAVRAAADAPAPEGKDAKPAAEVAQAITARTAGWAFKVQDFKAERLRRGMAKMLVDKKSGS